MLKSILSAIPSYALSCFQFPDSLCKEITTIFSIFWLGNDKDKRKIQFEKWENLRLAKDLKSFNKALFANVAWRILIEEESLLYKILKSKYFSHPSLIPLFFIWKSIILGRDLLQKGFKWRGGSGDCIKEWKDSWIPNSSGFKPSQMLAQIDVELRVKDLVEENTHTWNLDDLEKYFCSNDFHTIFSKPISTTGSSYKVIWHHTKSAKYEVKLGYHLAREMIRCEQLSNERDQSNASVHKEKKIASIGVAAIDNYVRMAMEISREKGWKKLQILSDAKNVVDMVLQRTIVSWDVETTCEDIWNLMKYFEVCDGC
uniref:RNase H type-1 domain-containing protein n=1 Tax=Solanum lycopersicum TaxID=4081 RepID=A0A3Q7G5S6_SOLLC